MAISIRYYPQDVFCPLYCYTFMGDNMLTTHNTKQNKNIKLNENENEMK